MLINALCSSCDFKAENYANLKEHADAEHWGILYPCKYCEMNVVSVEGLRRHELHYHSEQYDENAQLLHCADSEQCPYCEYTGKSRQRVLRQIKQFLMVRK